uniref:Ripening-related protein 5 n=1 Tax=Oryza barthii TaxID=65489 RepID=A0A0D3HF08_9ORYZ
MAMIFLLAALSTTHLASSLRPGAGGACRPSGYLPGKSGNCEKSNDPDCCEDGKAYPQYRCSPPVTAATGAVLTLNSFEKGKDGGGPSECDNAYHSDGELVVALSTGWFAGMARRREVGGGEGGGRVRLRARLRRRAQLRGAVRQQHRGRVAGGVGRPRPRQERRDGAHYLV